MLQCIGYYCQLAFFIFASSFVLAQANYISYLTGDSKDTIVAVQPAIVLAGGGTDNDDAMKWMLSRSKGGDILVIRASGSDGYNDYFYSELGITVNSVESIVFNSRNASYDAYILKKIDEAETIFIAGGDQGKYYAYWNNTPVGDLLKEIIQNRTKVVGGTSAGMLILGSIVYAPTGSGVTSTEALADPFHPNMSEMEYNTFMQAPVFKNMVFDTHFDDRNRAGRLMVFLARSAQDRNIRARAIACNESTVVCIDENNIASIFGDSPSYPDFAYFCEVNCEDSWRPLIIEISKPLHWTTLNNNAVIVQKLKGTKTASAKFNLNTWKFVTEGDIEYWQVENGILNKTNATFSGCRFFLSGIKDADIIVPDLYPNPSEYMVNFSYSDKAILYSSDGLNLSNCTNCKQIDVSKFASGNYLLVLSNGDVRSTTKMLILPH